MKKYLLENINILKEHIKSIDSGIRQNYDNPDYVENYIKIRNETLIELLNLYDILKKESLWDNNPRTLGSNTSPKNSFMD